MVKLVPRNKKVRRNIAALLFILCVLFTPLGVYYYTEDPDGPGPAPEKLTYLLVFWFPLTIKVLSNNLVIEFTSLLGILLPLFVVVHLWLIVQGIYMIRGNAKFQNIRNGLLLSFLLVMSAFFPAANSPHWGNIPLPFQLILGLIFAKWGVSPPPQHPFENSP